MSPDSISDSGKGTTMMATVTLFDPTAPQRGSEADGAQIQRIGLEGAVVGFIDNAKPNFSHLVDDLAELLMRRHGVSGIVKRRKSSASLPALPQVIGELARECDVVIAGSGD